VTIRNTFEKIVKSDKSLNYGRDIIKEWAKPGIILDIGCGRGTDLINLNLKKSELYGVENHTPYIKDAEAKGIKIVNIDLEKEKLPYENDFFDFIILNQIVEHTKEIFWIFSEVRRVLKPNGLIVVGVPNLAALHNRLGLLFGEQPSSIETFSAHVRGYTIPGFRRFITAGKYFKIMDVKGSNFYPFPAGAARVLSKIFPRMSVSLFFLLKKTGKKGKFVDLLKTNRFETNYFEG